MIKRQNDKKMGGLVRASRGEKSEGLNTFLGYFCCRLIMPVIFLVDTNYLSLLAYY